MTLLIIVGILIGGYLVLSALDHWSPRITLGADLRGRISLALVFLFTGLGHFLKTEPMVQMLPPGVPLREEIVYLTGVMELGAAVGLVIPRVAGLAGKLLIIFLVIAFPANIYAAMTGAEMGGHGIGAAYLLIRTPVQLILIGWTYWFAVRPAKGKS